MSRYIDADDLRHRILYFADAKNLNGNHEQAKAYNHCLIMIDESKTVDVVQCKDCKHFHDGIYNGEYWIECDEYRIALSSDEWFCADGERREDAEIH